MVREKDKQPKKSNVRKEGGSLVTAIPPEIIEHDNIEEGDTLHWQTEHSEKMEEKTGRGKYASTWNQTKQEQAEEQQ